MFRDQQLYHDHLAHHKTWDWSRISAVRRRWLTVWATTQLLAVIDSIHNVWPMCFQHFLIVHQAFHLPVTQGALSQIPWADCTQLVCKQCFTFVSVSLSTLSHLGESTMLLESGICLYIQNGRRCKGTVNVTVGSRTDNGSWCSLSLSLSLSTMTANVLLRGTKFCGSFSWLLDYFL
jgi:hypothetical protein